MGWWLKSVAIGIEQHTGDKIAGVTN